MEHVVLAFNAGMTNLFLFIEFFFQLPFEEFFERSSVGESGPPDTNVFLEAEIFHLVFYSRLFPVVRPFGLVRFDAPWYFYQWEYY